MTFTSTARRALVLALGLLAAAAGILLMARSQPAHAARAHVARRHVVRLSASKTALAFNKTRLTVRHGKVTIVDREALESASCECYRAATDLLREVTSPSRR